MCSKSLKIENSIFDQYESNVRSYCRSFPAVFETAQGSEMFTRDGKRYLDWLAGAGTLNYGHNNTVLLDSVMAYMGGNGVLHSLDMHTAAKERFIDTFQKMILKPRGLTYKLQFPGPTGTNAVEAALKLARKVTGRFNIVAFSNGFHGMTQGALAATANKSKRDGAGMMLSGVSHLPYDGFIGPDIDTMDVIEAMVLNVGSGLAPPAAFLVETVQGEGGLNTARVEWLQKLEKLARKSGALMIIDDIQAGVGRAEGFFSFDRFGLSPDVIVLSKSLSGIGVPFSLVLLHPELDVWVPGEHNGTFRGNNLAFVAAEAAIQAFWADDMFQETVARRATLLSEGLERLVMNYRSLGLRRRGRGMFTGLEFDTPGLPQNISAAMFELGIIVETCGHNDQVLKFLPPLTVSVEEVVEMLSALSEALVRTVQ